MTAPAFEIRLLKSVDLPRILPRILEIAASLKDAPHWTEAAWQGALDPDAAPRRIALGAIEPAGNTLLGFAVASLLPPQADLETIAVAIEGQRRGIGRALLHALAGQLGREGIGELWLEVRASNQPALALYRSAGFSKIGRRRNYYRDPEEDGLLLTLRLPA